MHLARLSHGAVKPFSYACWLLTVGWGDSGERVLTVRGVLSDKNENNTIIIRLTVSITTENRLKSIQALCRETSETIPTCRSLRWRTTEATSAMPLFSYSTATRNIHHSIGKAGFCIQRNLRNARKKVRKKVRNKRVERNEREKYATNVADVVDGTAILIIIHNPSATRSSALAI